MKLEHLYFLPIGGTAMAPLAGMLRQAGHRVEGVDSDLYPPMSTLLEEPDAETDTGPAARGQRTRSGGRRVGGSAARPGTRR